MKKENPLFKEKGLIFVENSSKNSYNIVEFFSLYLKCNLNNIEKIELFLLFL